MLFKNGPIAIPVQSIKQRSDFLSKILNADTSLPIIRFFLAINRNRIGNRSQSIAPTLSSTSLIEEQEQHQNDEEQQPEEKEEAKNTTKTLLKTLLRYCQYEILLIYC